MTTTPVEITPEQALALRNLGRDRPAAWAETVFGLSLWQKQQQVIQSVFDNKRTSVRSGSGIGKSKTAAVCAVTFLYNFKPSTVLTTAPTYRQVEHILWREIALIHGGARVYLDGKVSAVRLDINPHWFALGLSTDEPERFQGFHNENVLVIVDEASGVPAPVYQAIENPMATGNAHLLLIGNPTQQGGDFRDSFGSARFNNFHVSAFDTPNFTEFGIKIEDIRSGAWREKLAGRQLPRPYLVQPEWVSEQYQEYGENSYQWQVYVLGEFPESGVDTVFRLGDVERSMQRWRDVTNGTPQARRQFDAANTEKVAALDVSRYGQDETVFATRVGRRVEEFTAWTHQDTIYTEGRTMRQVQLEMPQTLLIDGVGVGGGVVDTISRECQGVRVIDFQSGAAAVDKERYGNRRAELYFKLARMLENDELDLPDDPRLKKDMLDVRYYFNKRGQLFIESKEEARARGVKSPDRLDSVIMLIAPTVAKGGGKPTVKYYF